MTEARRSSRERYEAALGLAWLSQFGCHSVLKLLGRWAPDDVWRASRACLSEWGVAPAAITRFDEQRHAFRVDEALAALTLAGVRFVPFGTALYPSELRQLSLPPAGLFVRGSEDAYERMLAAPRVTMVGTRKASTYGVHATEDFARAFVAAGVAVVSGLALGIDGRAHKAALEAGGLTAAVLGCGPDIVYPPRNRWLYQRIAATGSVVSELPPGATPARWTFPHRNRLLAALGDAVMVVEAPSMSGALQTVSCALDLGRPVFSVPGSIYAENQRGCNRLLYDGAGPALEPCVTVEDFLLQTRMQRGKRQPHDARRVEMQRAAGASCVVSDRAVCLDAIVAVLASGPSSADGLLERTGLPVRELTAALVQLELEGRVRRAGPGLYARAP